MRESGDGPGGYTEPARTPSVARHFSARQPCPMPRLTDTRPVCAVVAKAGAGARKPAIGTAPYMKFGFVVYLFIWQDARMSRPANPQTARALAVAGELRVLASQLKRRLREQANFGDLTLSQVAVLRRLEADGPATVTLLARAEGMRPQSMGANVAALQAAGFVTGTPDPSDGRQTLWSITPACREWIKAGRAAREDWLFRAIQKHLSADEQVQLASVLPLLKRVVES